MSCRSVLLVFLLAALVLAAVIAPGAAAPSSTNSSVLILYDSTGEYGWIGAIHARLLANLLGHFPVAYKASPVTSYTAGDINKYAATFYIGSAYEEPLPTAFKRDVMSSTKPICWFKYNIWQLAWTDNRFPTKFGFTFNWLDWTGYDTIHYKGQTFTKYQADPELGLVWVLYPTICKEIAAASRTSATGAEEDIPYIVHGGNIWYVADLPFAYVSEEDRYIVFCDVLHDVLGINHATSKRAIVRIEDVDPTTDPADLRRIADYLYSQRVPFLVSVVPVYSDPLGHYNNGVAEYDKLVWEPAVVDALKYMVQKGGKIILHGYTHQYDSTLNPYTGVTGDDYEFYRVQLDAAGATVYAGPLLEDSRTWASKRVESGRSELRAAGLMETGWETPHYAASGQDYRVFASKFPLTIQRVLYFEDTVKHTGFKGPHADDPSYFGGQFFPYVIQADIYAQKVIPENLGNYEPDPWPGYRPWYTPDILRVADKNLAVRDGWASFYFHPFYDLTQLQNIVQGIKAKGYTFVAVSSTLK
jgi:uncharacterized protein YdaL